MESAQRMNVAKYKTKPCRNYHSSTGCTRGDNCFFIHDPNYKGREIQNFDPRNYERNFPIQIPGFLPQGIGFSQIPTIPAQVGNQFTQMGQLGMNPMNFGMNLQQMMGLTGNMNNLNQGINKNENGEMDQFTPSNVMSGGMIQNNLENNLGVNGIGVGINNNNSFINGQIMEKGLNIPGYDFNYGVPGMQGQN